MYCLVSCDTSASLTVKGYAVLISFGIKNVRSIHDLTIPMTYGERKAPNGYREMDMLPFLEEGEIRVIPCLGLFGANGAGKSNVVKALSSCVQIIQEGYDPHLVVPNRLHPQSDVCAFDLQFVSNGTVYRYTLEVNGEEIIGETLTQDKEPIFSATKKEVRAGENTSLEELFREACFDEVGRFRTPFISVIGEKAPSLHNAVNTAYQYVANNIVFNLEPQFSGDASVLDEIAPMLKKLDVSIDRLAYDAPSSEVLVYRKDLKGKEVQFSLKEESEGIQRIVSLLGEILSALQTGKVVIIDGLELFLHPLLLRQVVRMFKDKRYNTTHAQLIFTTHATDLLEGELMRISEVGFLNNTTKEGTTFHRLSDFEGVRNVTNFRNHYINGAFSGIPFPYI